MALFNAHRIDPSRVTLMAMTESIAEHMALYSKIDIALDSFLYAGTTTTAEALFMGVPVVCWRRAAAPIHAQNVGVSLLCRIPGLDRFVATSKADYVRVCMAEAADLQALSATRAGLRRNMLASPLCNGPQFCRNLETVFRNMWQTYCKKVHDD